MRALGRAAGSQVVVCLLVLAAAFPLDTTLHDLAFRYVVSHEVRLLSNGFTALGTAWAASGLLVGLAVVAYRTADVGLLRVSLGGLGGVAIGSLASHGVKQLACRARPRLVDGWGVDPGGPPGARASRPESAAPGFFHWPCFADSRYQSFPSGHAATAFTVAAALTRVVPARRRIWLGVAGGIGASRVLLNAHFLSDVLGGALIGWWAGQLGLRLAERFAPVPAPQGRSRASVGPGRGTGAPSG